MGIVVFDENNMALCAIVIAGIQLIGFIVAAIFKLPKLVYYSPALTLTVVALMTFFLSQTYAPRQIVVTVFVVLWAVRQVVMLLTTRKTNEEDCCNERSRDFRFFIILFWSWLGQVGSAFAYGLVIMYTNSAKYSNDEFGAWEIVGTILACSGFLTEILSDAQAYFFWRYPANKDKFCDAGLWKWTRHPNLFGEIVLWWSFFIINCGVLMKGDWTAVISPSIFTFTIIFGFTIGYEKCSDGLYGEMESYRIYKEQTSPFIPFPPFVYKTLPTFVKFFFLDLPCYNKLHSSGEMKKEQPTENKDIVRE